MEPESCASKTYTAEAINSLDHDRHNHNESCLTFEMSRRMQKIEVYLAKEGSGLAFFTTDFGHFCRSNVDNEFGVMLRKKTSQTSNCLRPCPHSLFHDIQGPD